MVLPSLREGAEAAGRPVTDVTVVCPVMAAVGDTDAEIAAAREEARFRVAFYGSTRTYGEVFDIHGWEGTSDRLHELQRAGDVAGMAKVITDEMLDAYVVSSTWDDLAGVLSSRYGDVADRLVMYGAASGWKPDAGALDRWNAVTAPHFPLTYLFGLYLIGI